MQRTAWIWLAGCFAWTADGILQMRAHSVPRAELAFGVAAMFFIAWLFYRKPLR